jgi:acetylornithine deacetylase/succinyl-diaminopimelate desuccinylase-like protein
MITIDTINAYCTQNHQRFIDELRQFVRFKTIGNVPQYASAISQCVNWLHNMLYASGFTDVTQFTTSGNPVILATIFKKSTFPTIMFYAHYDIAAISDDASDTAPFINALYRHPFLYGRGSSDDKGQLWAHIKAVEYFLHCNIDLNVNIKVILEGNEETGSRPLLKLLKNQPSLFSADAVIISDMPMSAYNEPSIVYSLRGSFSFKVSIHRHHSERHSGNFGGLLIDPVLTLCNVLKSLYDIAGKDEFMKYYDTTEREFMLRNGFSNLSIRSKYSDTLPEEALDGRTFYENSTIMPSVAVTGLSAGSCEHEQNSIVSHASAIVNIRFPFTTDGLQWLTMVRNLLKRLVPATLKYTIEILSLSNGVEVDRNENIINIAHASLTNAFGKPPKYVRLGGTIPVVDTFYNSLSIPVLMCGSGLPDDAIHSRNERYHIPTFLKSITASILLLQRCALHERIQL